MSQPWSGNGLYSAVSRRQPRAEEQQQAPITTKSTASTGQVSLLSE